MEGLGSRFVRRITALVLSKRNLKERTIPYLKD